MVDLDENDNDKKKQEETEETRDKNNLIIFGVMKTTRSDAYMFISIVAYASYFVTVCAAVAAAYSDKAFKVCMLILSILTSVHLHLLLKVAAHPKAASEESQTTLIQ